MSTVSKGNADYPLETFRWQKVPRSRNETKREIHEFRPPSAGKEHTEPVLALAMSDTERPWMFTLSWTESATGRTYHRDRAMPLSEVKLELRRLFSKRYGVTTSIE